MPAQEVNQPQSQQMEISQTKEAGHVSAEQPRPAEQMTADPVRMRGGDEGADICCGLCAGLACFECLNCCC